MAIGIHRRIYFSVVWVQESPVEVDQLRRDKDELLNQLVSMQQQQESAAAESSKLSKKVSHLGNSFVSHEICYCLCGRRYKWCVLSMLEKTSCLSFMCVCVCVLCVCPHCR